MKPWHWIVIGTSATGVLLAALWARKKAGGSVAGADDRIGPDGIVPGKPEDLARLAGASVDEYSLARMMESEEGTTAGRTAVGWAARNEAKREKITVTKLLTRATVKDKATGKTTTTAANGKYSKQELHKWCSTTNPPTAATLALAKQIMAEPPKVSDPTHGATQWDAPALQDAQHKKNPSTYKSSEEIAAKRQAAGKKLVMVAGVAKTRFWA